jgi:hypothetical protein
MMLKLDFPGLLIGSLSIVFVAFIIFLLWDYLVVAWVLVRSVRSPSDLDGVAFGLFILSPVICEFISQILVVISNPPIPVFWSDILPASACVVVLLNRMRLVLTRPKNFQNSLWSGMLHARPSIFIVGGVSIVGFDIVRLLATDFFAIKLTLQQLTILSVLMCGITILLACIARVLQRSLTEEPKTK